jgi:hypothetical protein
MYCCTCIIVCTDRMSQGQGYALGGSTPKLLHPCYGAGRNRDRAEHQPTYGTGYLRRATLNKKLEAGLSSGIWRA